MKRRLLNVTSVALLSLALASGVFGQSKPKKPIDSDAIAKSLITLRQKARDAGLDRTVDTLTKAIAEISNNWESSRVPAVVPCTTDTDCEEKNPRR